MNPYDFVRVEWKQPGRRAAALKADRFGGISGRLEGTITALTPILIRRKDKKSPDPFMVNGEGTEIIPGSSLKGLFRSLVETVGGGAWWFFGDKEANLPPAFRRPADPDHLDAACRMFGFLNGGQVLQGRVCFDDAVCTVRRDREAFYTCILSTPKPRHRVWYLDAGGRYVAGRKFYFHAQELSIASGWLPKDAEVSKRQTSTSSRLTRRAPSPFRLSLRTWPRMILRCCSMRSCSKRGCATSSATPNLPAWAACRCSSPR
ncbi:MAG: hypothetical protein HC884_16095 [Chloroflexaceae bacterium]|nr:hypothetical protein [Chloroflexaceae bacterium]